MRARLRGAKNPIRRSACDEAYHTIKSSVTKTRSFAHTYPHTTTALDDGIKKRISKVVNTKSTKHKTLQPFKTVIPLKTVIQSEA
jgi:PHP family Zn ribbon phosphoesterase